MPLVRKPTGTGTPDEARAEPTAARALDALVTGNDDERWSAARAAAAFPDSVGNLGKALQSEKSPRVREAIFTSLARIATPLSVETVLPFVRSDDAQVRTEALDALAAMKSAIWPHLAALAHDPSPAVRVLACELVRTMPNDRAVPLFCDILESDPEANVCASAIDALAEIGHPDSLPALAACAERFKTAPFLVFSIKIATDRIRSQVPKPSA